MQITSSTTLSQLDIMRLNLAFSRECNKRNIGDLLITCKNSLTSLKEKPELLLNAPDVDEAETNRSVTEEAEADQKVDEEVETEDGQSENTEEQNTDKVEISKEDIKSNEVSPLKGGK